MNNALRSREISRIQDETGIDEELIFRLVHAFYGRVRKDPLLGPIFATRISDWEPHLARMCDFWSSVILMSGRYHGQPMPVHLPLPIGAQHFDRWVALFEETAIEVCPTKRAVTLFVERARRIAASLELGIATSRGIYLAKGERYYRQDNIPDVQTANKAMKTDTE